MVELQKTKAGDELAFANMFNLYHYDLAKFLPELYPSVDEDGYYDRNAALEYLNMPPAKVQTSFIRYMGKIAGLAVLTFPPFVKPGCDYCIQELFVLRALRGQGIAREACEKIFCEFPGRYCALVLENNIEALAFWDKVTAKGLIARGKHDDALVAYEFAAGK